MDEASRMARAREMGFDTTTPLYRGTDTDITAFDRSHLGRSGSMAAREGFFLACDPQTASDFARRVSSTGAGSGGGTPNVLPLLHRARNPGRIRLAGDDLDHEVAATLNQAFQLLNKDAVRIENYTTPAGESGKTILVVRDPQQLRSRFAAFDPAKIDSPDLLAGALPLAVLERESEIGNRTP